MWHAPDALNAEIVMIHRILKNSSVRYLDIPENYKVTLGSAIEYNGCATFSTENRRLKCKCKTPYPATNNDDSIAKPHTQKSAVYDNSVGASMFENILLQNGRHQLQVYGFFFKGEFLLNILQPAQWQLFVHSQKYEIRFSASLQIEYLKNTFSTHIVYSTNHSHYITQILIVCMCTILYNTMQSIEIPLPE